MYTQHREKLDGCKGSSEQLTHGASSHAGNACQSQAGISSICEMQTAIAHLLKIFMESQSEMRNVMNLWQVQFFNSITSIGYMQSDTDDEYLIDYTFRKMAPRVALDTFIAFVPYAGQKTSVIWVSRVYCWITCIKEDPSAYFMGYHEGVWNRMS